MAGYIGPSGSSPPARHIRGQSCEVSFPSGIPNWGSSALGTRRAEARRSPTGRSATLRTPFPVTLPQSGLLYDMPLLQGFVPTSRLPSGIPWRRRDKEAGPEGASPGYGRPAVRRAPSGNCVIGQSGNRVIPPQPAKIGLAGDPGLRNRVIEEEQSASAPGVQS